VLKLSSNVSDMSLKVLNLSSEVSEGKPLRAGGGGLGEHAACFLFEVLGLGQALCLTLGSYRQGLTLVHFSAQPEPFLTFNTSPKPLNTPSTPALNTP